MKNVNTFKALEVPRHLIRAVTENFIDGKFTSASSHEKFPAKAPAHDANLSEVAHSGSAEIDHAVTAATRALHGPWGKTSASDRALILRRIGDVIQKRLADFALVESLDTGKPLSETTQGDIPRSAFNFHFFSELCAHQPGQIYEGADGSRHMTFREPLGVVGLITPWNLPLYLATWKLAPALAQGNTVVLKPAELTPLSAALLAEVLQECDLPPGVVNIVQGFGPNSAGQALVEHPGVRAISFTGETVTGSAIMAAASKSLKKLSFELGGKGATVIFADSDVENACATACRAAFRNQGQVCLAGSRLIVEESIAPQVIERVLSHIQGIKVGDPLDPSTTMGSLICKDHRDKVSGYVQLARTLPGVEILCGGKIPEGLAHGAFYAPTLITNPAQSSRLIQEEIFGPVLTIQTFRTEGEALELLNGTPFGLSCSIFTDSQARSKRFAKAAKFGMVWINGWFLRDLHTPFGGMKRSGVGREGGQYALDFFSEPKAVTWA